MKIIAIIGKSGSGKDTFKKEFLRQRSNFMPYVYYTTRPMRPKEKEGEEYFFISKEEFKKKKNEKFFVSTTEYNTTQGIWEYGIERLIEDTTDSDVFIITPSPNQLKDLIKSMPNTTFFIFELQTDDEKRIIKLFEREDEKENPDYKEIIRRLKTDREDFDLINFLALNDNVVYNTIYNDYGEHISIEEIIKDMLFLLKL